MRGLAFLLVLSLAGCGPLQQSRATRWLNQVNPFASAPGDKVVLRTYLLDPVDHIGTVIAKHDKQANIR